MSAEFAERPHYVNGYVYGLTQHIFQYEREEGFNSSADSKKKLSVLMPEPWGSLRIVADLEGNFQDEFEVVGVSVELDDGRSEYSHTFNEDWLEPPDAYNQDFITALENYSLHDHSICLLKYNKPGRVALSERTARFYTSDAAVITYPKGKLLECFIEQEESERAEAYWEETHAAGE